MQCNHRDKAKYYSTIKSDSNQDPEKLWHALQHFLDKEREMAFLPHQSEKSSAKQYAPSSIKISKGFMTCSQLLPQQLYLPCMCTPPNLPCFNEVSENKVVKIIKNYPTKLCLLDLVPTFLLKDCVELLLPSITKLVNLSSAEGVFPQNLRRRLLLQSFKSITFKQRFKKLSTGIRNMFHVKIGGAGSCQTAHAAYQ